jgi:Ca-activated chloride channel family protein
MIEYFRNIEFATPWVLSFLLLVPLTAVWYRMRYARRFSAIKLSSIEALNGLPVSWRVRLMPLPFILRLLAVAAIVIALARPQTYFSEEEVSTEGIDLVLAMDVSKSMWAVDFRPNRIEAAKETAIEFVNGRPYDRMGLVVFAGEAFTQCPITLDHNLLKGLILEADRWRIEDRTAIGDGLLLSLNRLMDSTSLDSKVVILLTDGVQTAGEFSPLDAARAAKEMGIRIYTIGIGSRSGTVRVLHPKTRAFLGELDQQNSLDEETLTKVAEQTGGKYFRATDKTKLREIYEEIDQLEKEKVEVSVMQRFQDKFYPFAWFALACILLEILLSQTILRTAT